MRWRRSSSSAASASFPRCSWPCMSLLLLQVPRARCSRVRHPAAASASRACWSAIGVLLLSFSSKAVTSILQPAAAACRAELGRAAAFAAARSLSLARVGSPPAGAVLRADRRRAAADGGLLWPGRACPAAELQRRLPAGSRAARDPDLAAADLHRRPRRLRRHLHRRHVAGRGAPGRLAGPVARGARVPDRGLAALVADAGRPDRRPASAGRLGHTGADGRRAAATAAARASCYSPDTLRLAYEYE